MLLVLTLSTECVMDLDYQNEMIIIILTTFEASFIFKAAEVKIGSSLKPNHHDQVLPS